MTEEDKVRRWISVANEQPNAKFNLAVLKYRNPQRDDIGDYIFSDIDIPEAKYNDAVIKYNEGNFNDALEQFESIEKGTLTEKVTLAVSLCHFAIGIKCLKGIKSEKAQALDHFQKAPKCDKSNLYIGVCYFYGYGIAVDRSKALEYFIQYEGEDLAQRLIPSCHFYIGKDLFENENFDDAITHFKEAEKGKIEEATVYKGNCLINKGEIDGGLSIFEEAKDEFKSAKEHFREYSYKFGIERFKNGEYEASLVYFEKAEASGKMEAALYIGLCNFDGKGTEENKEAAFKNFNKAADVVPLAKFYLGLCYILGQGVEQDKVKGIRLLEEAKNSGCEYAGSYLAIYNY